MAKNEYLNDSAEMYNRLHIVIPKSRQEVTKIGHV